MQLHNLQRHTKRATSHRVGRGGKRGKTSGRGTKGQKARAGHRMRPEMRDLIKKIPKLRGHGKNRSRTINPTKYKPIPVNLAAIEAVFKPGDVVSPQTLLSHKVIRSGKTGLVKILGTGTLSKKVSVVGCTLSAFAKKAVEAAGGSVTA
jgi:large subunit ribosomal protein L15